MLCVFVFWFLFLFCVSLGLSLTWSSVSRLHWLDWQALGIYYLSLPPWHWAFKHSPLNPTEKDNNNKTPKTQKIVTSGDPVQALKLVWQAFCQLGYLFSILPQCQVMAATGGEGNRAACLGMPVSPPLQHEELKPHR